MPTARLFDLFGEGGAATWGPYAERGYAVDVSEKHSGGRAIVCSNAAADGVSGALQGIELHQTTPTPIIVSGWSKAENVSGTADGNYALYVDATYTDGENLFGQIAPFTVGMHDWEFQTVTIHPTKPIASLTLYVLFRYKSGKVWFDDVTLRQENGPDLVQNGGFEEANTRGRVLDVSATREVSIPAYSGRVYLFASDTSDQLALTGPKLTVITQPAMGEVRFRVDGFDYWTFSGRWTTEYTLGPMFGKFDITFTAPGKHTVEIIDVTPADMKTPAGYGSGERLGEFMDPSNPTKPSEGKKFKFREWRDLGTSPHVELDVTVDTTVTALFDVEQAKTSGH
jgi:hypothetical protein